ncbi:EPIDERMAL PATTERNING FACTOR-like protein 2 [Salvia hispanica]|uniref:EPIDERMAL PATTERNING FACTOR-like protein 2 n=1 Tax=Salvia hispanica TaxID=49212 RepID=UPI002008F949|nr:EPIDERMAL PATTERNING FACTOR-like protein 2 [Salvia hispanica]
MAIILHTYLIVLAFLFIFIAQGTQLPNAHLLRMKDEEIRGEMLGSRPPKCKERCGKCGHCEAVQVPIGAAIKYGKMPRIRVEYSRGDDVSAYKPMCWKCKCGNFIFNP